MGEEETTGAGVHCMAHGAIVERMDNLDDKINNRLNLVIWVVGLGFGANLMFGAYIAGTMTKLEKSQAVASEKVDSIEKRVLKIEGQMEQVQRHIYIGEVLKERDSLQPKYHTYAPVIK